MYPCLTNESQSLDPWPNQTVDTADFQFENNFIPSQQSFQPLPDKEEYLHRLGECILLHNTSIR